MKKLILTGAIALASANYASAQSGVKNPTFNSAFNAVQQGVGSNDGAVRSTKDYNFIGMDAGTDKRKIQVIGWSYAKYVSNDAELQALMSEDPKLKQALDEIIAAKPN